jgi:hypothetical protein
MNYKIMIKETILLVLIGTIILPVFAQDTLGTDVKGIVESAEPDYLTLSNITINQYAEDRRYSIFILDNLTKGNITEMDAMNSLSTLYVFESELLSSFDEIQPPIPYSIFHDEMIKAIKSLKWYLFYAAKYIESGRADYSKAALDSYILTSDSFKEALAARDNLPKIKEGKDFLDTSRVGGSIFKIL